MPNLRVVVLALCIHKINSVETRWSSVIFYLEESRLNRGLVGILGVVPEMSFI